MAFNNVKDTVSGAEGIAFATINGNIEELAYLKKVEFKVEKNKEEVKTLGKRGTGSKTRGWKGTGSMTIYYMTSIFRNLMSDYNKTGKDTYFDIQVTNEDSASETGKQTTVLKNCNIDGVIIAKLDIDATAMDEEISFTFDDFEILDSFNNL
ncbi:phage tail tube protein [Pseudobacteroides cellulosolvens]|uniref:XkdM protein, phage-like element PBSX n=1 Tax=Pseudobacteroides cellulosolvens ATCC 35603 = DSM 2933 TaxID=398512 RepID=A0A0L6JH20_9FIRM|nr:phage tail tube protein [Pseudobacteroides cellulosolvens]KNY25005.1 XkdM protein, phage-like element PBSX [Pseudobacteroides cellulosolvens ATCC 35603 = DSM 2933]